MPRLARVHPSVRSFVHTYVRTYATVVLGPITRPQGASRRAAIPFRCHWVNLSQDYRSSFIRYKFRGEAARARDMRYYKIYQFAKERPSAPTRKSLARVSSEPFFLFVSEREDGSPNGQSGPSSVSLIARGGATGAGHPPEGEREGEPLTGARGAGSARARATRASALRGPRGPYPLGIYPDFYIADKVLATLGEGTFGKVVKVKDLQM